MKTRFTTCLIHPLLLLLVIAGLGYASTTVAQGNAPPQPPRNCRITLVPMDFGLYYPMQTAPLDITSTITVRCGGSTGGTFTLGASTGSSNSFSQRSMLAGAGVLNYNLFIDPARTIIWGDVSSQNVIVGVIGRGKDRKQNINIYGRVFSSQDPVPGIYNDVVTITVNF